MHGMSGRLDGANLALAALVLAAAAGCEGAAPPAPAAAAPADAVADLDMRLIGHNDLQARSAYQPIVHAYGERRILFVGHHAGEALNPATGFIERNGLSILDVTDPARPMALLIKSLLGLLVAYLLLVVAAYYVQRRLMYFPDTARVTPASIGLANVTERVLETPDGERVIAWHAPARPDHPTILYFHGNGGALEARSERVRKYVEQGHGMFMMTYRGYGGSTGVPSEPTNVADAKLAYDTLVNEGVRGRDIIVYGESLGSGVAVQVAAGREVGGLILDAPYTSAVDVAELVYPYLPARWLMTDRYETLRHLPEVNAPLLVVHGEKDTIIPIAMGRRVHAAAKGPAEIVTFPQAGHSDHHLYGSYEAINAWIEELRGSGTRAGEASAPERVPRDRAPPG